MPNPKDLVSHGRGGAANIHADSTQYTDGSIVRKGVEGDQGDGPFSTGRGGQANIGGVRSPRMKPADQEEVPENARRQAREGWHHTGRGGAGNELHVSNEEHKKEKEGHHEEGLADKLKHKIGVGHKEGQEHAKT